MFRQKLSEQNLINLYFLDCQPDTDSESDCPAKGETVKPPGKDDSGTTGNVPGTAAVHPSEAAPATPGAGAGVQCGTTTGAGSRHRVEAAALSGQSSQQDNHYCTGMTFCMSHVSSNPSSLKFIDGNTIFSMGSSLFDFFLKYHK